MTALPDLRRYLAAVKRPIGCTPAGTRGRVRLREAHFGISPNDYPHFETTRPDSQANIERHFSGLSEAERRPIVRDNALRFFGLPG